MVLERVGLDAKARMPARELSHGDQRHLEIAMAIATNPKLVLLDEPTSGMSLFESNATMELIHGLRKEVTILLIEHHMELVMNSCTTLHVLDFGKKIAEGRPEEIKKNEQVLQAYLGDEV